MGPFLVSRQKREKMQKWEFHSRLVQNFSKLYRKLILIWAFRKSTLETDTKKTVFFLSVSQMLSHSNEPKKNFNKLPSWDFFFLLFYMKIQITKNSGVREEKKNFRQRTPKPPKRHNSLLVWIDKKIFLNFCYLIRVEHIKSSEICFRIVRFGLKLRKLDHF